MMDAISINYSTSDVVIYRKSKESGYSSALTYTIMNYHDAHVLYSFSMCHQQTSTWPLAGGETIANHGSQHLHLQ